MNILSKSLKDFFSIKFLLLSTLPFLISFLVFGGFFLYSGSEFINFLNSGGNNFTNINPNVHPVISYIFTLALVKWILITFFFFFGTILIVFVSVVIAIIVIGFFTPYIVKTLQEKYYPNFIRGEVNFSKSVWLYIKTVGIFLFLIFVAIPLLIVPGVNFFIFNIPFYYLFHNLLIIDIGSNIENYKRFGMIIKKERKSFVVTTLIFYTFSLIPVLGLFLQLFFVIYLTHLFFEKSIENTG